MEKFKVGQLVWQPSDCIGIQSPHKSITILQGKYNYNVPFEKIPEDIYAEAGVFTSTRDEVRRLRSEWKLEENNKQTQQSSTSRSDGSSADYYELPTGCTQLQDLISHRNMNAQVGEIFRAMYRYGHASHSDQLRDAKKVKFYIEAEIKRLENLQ